jgi:hypothetical protein
VSSPNRPGSDEGTIGEAGRGARALGGLRILEIGDVPMFAQGAPANTELVWTAHHEHVEGVGRPNAFGWRRLPALRRALDRGEFDLVVGHPPAEVPWHPTRIAAMLRRFGRGAPALIVRGFGTRLLLRPTRTPLAIVDLGDSTAIRPHNFPMLERARLYFKRELPADRWKAFAGALARDLPSRRQRRLPRFAGWCSKLVPISLAVSPDRAADIVLATTPPAEKTIDVFFAGQVETSSTVRAAGLSELRALAREGIRVDLATERLDRREFYRRCARAWITWSPEGLGWECFRHYEAPLCGSVPLMNQPSILRHAPLRAGEHALYYEVEPGGLARSIRAALADHASLGRMAAAAHDHVRRYQTLERLCEHVVQTCLGDRPAPPASATGQG